MRRFRLVLLIAGLATQQFFYSVEVRASPQNGLPKYQKASYRQLRLLVNRSPQAIELVVQGAGPKTQVSGRFVGTSWEGLLAPSQPSLLSEGKQVFDLPGNDFSKVELTKDGSKFKLSVRGRSVSQLVAPTITVDGTDLILRFAVTGQSQVVRDQYDLNQPGRLNQSKFVPPFRPRAVAPPVGDMAIGTMLLKAQGFLEV